MAQNSLTSISYSAWREEEVKLEEVEKEECSDTCAGCASRTRAEPKRCSDSASSLPPA